MWQTTSFIKAGCTAWFFFITLLFSLYPASAAAEEFELLWSHRHELGGDSGPFVVAEGHLFFGTLSRLTGEAQLICLDQSTGAIEWTISHERIEPDDLDNHSSGIRSRPAIDIATGLIAYYSNRGELVVADIDGQKDGDQGKPDNTSHYSGDIVSSIDLVNELGVFKRDDGEFGCGHPSPIIAKGIVYCATGNGSTHNMHNRRDRFVPSPEAPAMVAVPVAKGFGGWRWHDASPSIVHSACASPLFVSLDCASNALFAPAGNGEFYIIDAKTGTTIAEAANHWFWSWNGPVDAGDDVILASDSPPGLPGAKRCGVYAISKRLTNNKTIDIRWSAFPPDFNGTYVSPVIIGDFVFVISRYGTLSAIDRQSGKLYWQHAVDYYPSLDRTELFVVNSSLIVPIEGGLAVLSPDKGTPRIRELALGVTLRSGVAVSGSCVYGSDGFSVYAWRYVK